MLRSGVRKLTLAGVLALTWAAACGSDQADAIKRAGLADGCSINTDCKSPLVCAFRRCHTQCEDQRDCDPAQLCIPADKPFNVCQLGDEAECTHHSDCPSDFRCAIDLKCRPECITEKDCINGQQCVDGVCAADEELVDGGFVVDASPDSSIGNKCVYASDCPIPLVCIAGTCLPECKEDRDCPTGFVCNSSQTCVPPGGVDGGSDAGGPSTCANGQQDPGETAVDCGGPCGACSGAGCTKPSDCASHVCGGQKCQAPTCADGLQNGTESDIDCGGPSCSKCPAQKGCWSPLDCNTGTCKSGICTDMSCSDKVKGGGETDVDCGGFVCGPCADGKSCDGNADCTSQNCVSKKCVPPGPTTWTESYNGTGARVTADPAGNMVVAGTISGTVTIGGIQLTAAGSADIFLAKFTPAGALLWAERQGGISTESVVGLETDASGNVLIAGQTNSATPSFGGPPVNCTGSSLYIAKYAAANGAHIWSHCVDAPTASYINATGAGLDSAGNLYVGGTFYGTLDFGVAQVVNPYYEAFVVKYAALTGDPVWLLEIKATNSGGGGAPPLAFAPNGNDMIVAGEFSSATTFGTAMLSPIGQSDIYFAKVAASDGSLTAVKGFGDSAADHVADLATTSSGKVLVAGSFTGQVDFGTGLVAGKGGLDAFVMEVDPSSMTTTWANGYGSTAEDRATAVASAQNGEVVLTAFMAASANFGGGPLTYVAAKDTVVAHYSASGGFLSAKSYGGINNDEPVGVAWIGTSVGLSGSYSSGFIDFGNGNLPSGGNAYIAHIPP